MIEVKTLRYLDVLEVLSSVEASTGRVGLKERVWSHLQETVSVTRDAMTYINIEDDHSELIRSCGKYLGDDLEAIKQAVSHLPMDEISWYATW